MRRGINSLGRIMTINHVNGKGTLNFDKVEHSLRKGINSLGMVINSVGGEGHSLVEEEHGSMGRGTNF